MYHDRRFDRRKAVKIGVFFLWLYTHSHETDEGAHTRLREQRDEHGARPYATKARAPLTHCSRVDGTR